MYDLLKVWTHYFKQPKTVEAEARVPRQRRKRLPDGYQKLLLTIIKFREQLLLYTDFFPSLIN